MPTLYFNLWKPIPKTNGLIIIVFEDLLGQVKLCISTLIIELMLKNTKPSQSHGVPRRWYAEIQINNNSYILLGCIMLLTDQ